jgi:hypothetical protein
MPDLTIRDFDSALFEKLQAWAEQQNKALPDLALDILAAAQRAHEHFDPTMDQTTRDIRRCRDGGCGLCVSVVLRPRLSKAG